MNDCFTRVILYFLSKTKIFFSKQENEKKMSDFFSYQFSIDQKRNWDENYEISACYKLKAMQ